MQGSRPPLFCVRADGSVFIYRRFAEYLDPSIPNYGLQAHGLANPTHQPFRHVDEMAAHYIREIRTVQPQGPYHLCAFSAGGLIIFEMARQLHQMGEQVAFVTLCRSSPAAHQPMPRKIRYEYIARPIDHAAQMYPRGRAYPGTGVLFHALTQPEGIKPDPTLGWGHLVTGDLKIIDVIGTHNSIMMHDLHVAELVHKIGDHLSQLPNRLPAGKLTSNSFSSTTPQF